MEWLKSAFGKGSQDEEESLSRAVQFEDEQSVDNGGGGNQRKETLKNTRIQIRQEQILVKSLQSASNLAVAPNFEGKKVWIDGHFLRRFFSCQDGLDDIFQNAPTSFLKSAPFLCEHQKLAPRSARQGALLRSDVYDVIEGIVRMEYAQFLRDCDDDLFLDADSVNLMDQKLFVGDDGNDFACKECGMVYQQEAGAAQSTKKKAPPSRLASVEAEPCEELGAGWTKKASPTDSSTTYYSPEGKQFRLADVTRYLNEESAKVGKKRKAPATKGKSGVEEGKRNPSQSRSKTKSATTAGADAKRNRSTTGVSAQPMNEPNSNDTYLNFRKDPEYKAIIFDEEDAGALMQERRARNIRRNEAFIGAFKSEFNAMNGARRGKKPKEPDGSDTEDLSEEGNDVTRVGQKENLLQNLRSHNTAVRPSGIHGVGLFALAPIPRGTTMFRFNGEPNARTISVAPEDLDSLPEHVQTSVRDFFLPDKQGLYHIPNHGLSCALGVSYYLNSAEGTNHQPNVKFGSKLDASGLAEMITTRDIKTGEEHLLQYNVNNPSKGAKRQKTEKLRRGRFSGKKAEFWENEDEQWVPGRIHEYVSAEERNTCGCRNVECECPKHHRGMYHYTIWNRDVDDHFSDGDVTVRIAGRSGKDLWQSSLFVAKRKTSKPKNAQLPKKHTDALFAKIKKLVSMLAEEEQLNGNHVFYWNIMNGTQMGNLASKVPTSINDLYECDLSSNTIKQYGCCIVNGIASYIEKEDLQQYIESGPKKDQKTLSHYCRRCWSCT